jgi:RNA-binding protein
MNLSTKQRVFLRGLGQPLKPQLHVGHGGFGPGSKSALEDAFRTRELVKVRILNTSEETPKELAAMVAQEAGAELVGVVGKTFVLYRPNPNLKEQIELPTAGAGEPGSTRGSRGSIR